MHYYSNQNIALLVKGQVYKATKQNRESRNRSTHIWPTDEQKRQLTEKQLYLINYAERNVHPQGKKETITVAYTILKTKEKKMQNGSGGECKTQYYTIYRKKKKKEIIFL